MNQNTVTTQTILYILVEGKADKKFLTTIFVGKTFDVHTFLGSQNLLTKSASFAYQHRKEFILVLADTDSSLEEAILQKNEDYQDFGYFTDERHRLAFFVPEMEIVFCKEKYILEKIIGTKISEVDHVKAQYEPKKTLLRLLQLNNADSLVEICLSRLDENDFAFMRDNIEPLTQVQQFLEYAATEQK